ncbi:phage terminase small subunit [Blastomonas sp.]|uniref:phage terminase small subunit n=1 Tax=Blastomonas sp. TaxID=1909299 RepID=UPI00406A6750
MTSLARRHRERALAAKAGLAETSAIVGQAVAMPETGEVASEYRALYAVLQDNLRSLSDIQSIDGRNPVKREMAETFRAWVDGALAAGADGNAAQDEIVAQMMVWAIDYRDFERALDIGEHVLRFGIKLPERYLRTPACLLAEDIATAVLADPELATLEQIVRLARLTGGYDMPDQARAKLLKAMGRAFAKAAEEFDPEADSAPAGGKPALLHAALDAYKRALQLNKAIGVKKDIERLERLVALPAGETGQD